MFRVKLKRSFNAKEKTEEINSAFIIIVDYWQPFLYVK